MPGVDPVTPEVFPLSDDADVALLPSREAVASRRVVLVPLSPGTPRSVQGRSVGSSGSRFAVLESDDEEAEMEHVVRQEEERSADEETHSAHESDTVSFDWPADNGSVVSGVEEPPEVEEVVDVEEIRVLTVGFRAALSRWTI